MLVLSRLPPHKMFRIIKPCYEGKSHAPKLIVQIIYLLSFFFPLMEMGMFLV